MFWFLLCNDFCPFVSTKKVVVIFFLEKGIVKFDKIKTKYFRKLGQITFIIGNNWKFKIISSQLSSTIKVLFTLGTVLLFTLEPAAQFCWDIAQDYHEIAILCNPLWDCNCNAWMQMYKVCRRQKMELMCIGSSCFMTSIRHESHKTHAITNLQALVTSIFPGWASFILNICVLWNGQAPAY